MKKKAKFDPQKLAKTYHCDLRTIRRWRRQKAPFDRPAAMFAWLGARKSLPSGTRDWLAEQQAAQRVSAMARAENSGLPTGAMAALKRLETAESRAFAYLECALSKGDPSEIKLAREGWLKIGDSLRRYDLIVEKTRREVGELVKRSDVERILEWVGRWWRWAVQQQADNIASACVGLECHQIRTHLIERFDDGFLTVLAAVIARGGVPTPPWVTTALLKGQNDVQGDVELTTASRVEAFKELFALSGEAALQRVREMFGLPGTRSV